MKLFLYNFMLRTSQHGVYTSTILLQCNHLVVVRSTDSFGSRLRREFGTCIVPYSSEMIIEDPSTTLFTKPKVFLMKQLLITALLLTVAASYSYAQLGTGHDATFTTTATVLSTLSVTNTDDLEFDDVIQGDNKTVGANTTSGAVTTSYGTGQLADFAITGTATKEVGAYLTTTNQLSDGTNTLTLEDWVAYSNTTNSLIGASTQADPTNWTNHIAVTLDGSGNGYMWLGATAKPTGAQAPGNYTVDNTFTFYYTGN